MTLAEVKKELEVFNKYQFFEEGHYYECNGVRVEQSVTRLIEEYSQPFEAEMMAEKVAKRDGKSVSEVLQEWEDKNKTACLKGSMCHEKAQSLWNGIIYQESEFDLTEWLKMALEKIYTQANNFYNDYKDKFTHIQDEQLVGDEEYDICSAIDHLFLDNDGNVILADYKTNSYMTGYNKKCYGKMKVPLQNLEDSSLKHYYLQLSIYKYLVEKNTNIKIHKMIIVYMSENIDNYELIEVPYLKEEVESILRLRRKKNMAKMLLIMGEGGNGKTSSLRNIPSQQHYYIDCDKKGLNYKGWKEDYNEEKKNYFKTNDGEMVIKLLKGISEKREDIKYITIDTINSIMIADEMKRSKDKSFDKWQDLASCIFNIINIVPDLRDDLTVIFIGHTQTDEDGFVRLLTNGKKLNKIGLEKYFNTVLLAKCADGKYYFETRANNSTARTPMGAFEELEIENDIMKVLDVLKEF